VAEHVEATTVVSTSSATNDASPTTNEAVPELVEGTATKPVKAPDAIMTKFIGFLKFRHYRKKKRTFN